MIPSSVDCIIIGTGLTNSILAAACSRIGKSVLHVDKNNYYGDEWASFTFQQLIDWIETYHPNDPCLESVPEDLKSKSRMFCIDLCPRPLYSNGAMVDLLVKSNVSRYHEFNISIRILSMIQDKIHVMPCRRSDVFTSPLLSDLIDKRRLMKFIEMCVEYDPNVDARSSEHQSSSSSSPTGTVNDIELNANKPIGDFLDEKGLKPTLKEFLISSIAMVEPTESTSEACKKIKNFMVATERYGKSPFMFPIYGCGEFPQSFCRLSAVYGGLYCLNTRLDNFKIRETTQPTGSSSENFSVKLSNKECEINCDMLIMDYTSALSSSFTNMPSLNDKLARAILITSSSVVPSNDNLTSFLRIPSSEKNANIVYLLEFNSSVMVCPPDINIVYMWTKSTSDNSQKDLWPSIERVFGNDLSMIRWKFFYHQLSGPETGIVNTDEVAGLYITSPPCNELDYTQSIKEAENIFNKMCPDQEFLPRAPDPDEIII